MVWLVGVVGRHALDLNAEDAEVFLRLQRAELRGRDPGVQGLPLHGQGADKDGLGLCRLAEVLGREVVKVRMGEKDEIGVVPLLFQAEGVDIGDDLVVDADAAVFIDGDVVEHSVSLLPELHV